ncbi:MAG: hypothetical protein QOF87_4168 [Pseudonocardiales bacterium]|nr:hypothetical protein [Pseudonocardiales bacterium]MDT4964521.1 hypothetical protein [Pseudonocardiales bacterium]MDT4972270.1 hypothetical protein [Pseudonocardiales bacterium]MDT4979021.1 hypothetical protein [Pseudonocardiales bacterium]
MRKNPHVLIRPAELAAIHSGDVDLAFRRWDRPRLRVGTRMRTGIGLVEVTSVDRVALKSITGAEAQRAGAASVKELLTLLAHRPDSPIFRVGLRYAGPDPRIALRADAELTADERDYLVRRLQRLDDASPRGPWTQAALAIIARRPATRAADLAEELGRDLVTFKRDVRKLKELGLTESLEVGYRLSPRALALDRAAP